MGIFRKTRQKAKHAASKVGDALESPATATVLMGDALIIDAPSPGTTWMPGDHALVTWHLKGVTAYPVDVTLVRTKGTRVKDVAVLATGLTPNAMRAEIVVPDVPPGDDYAILVSSDDPLQAYSRTLTITVPGA
jgi:hypothetical protein